jgi:hypothetical protein
MARQPARDATVDRTPEDIAHEIELTRAELSDTIDAIAARINPRRKTSRTGRAAATATQPVISLDEPATETAPPDPQAGAAAPASGSVDPRLLAAGAAAGAAVGLVALRRHRK